MLLMGKESQANMAKGKLKLLRKKVQEGMAKGKLLLMRKKPKKSKQGNELLPDITKGRCKLLLQLARHHADVMGQAEARRGLLLAECYTLTERLNSHCESVALADKLT